MPAKSSALITLQAPLLADIRDLIHAARERLAQTFNAGLVLLYWQIGQRIRKVILKEKRAQYGQEIFYALSRKLVAEFGRGFSPANLFHMVRCAEVFPDPRILHALGAALSWTHFRRLIYLTKLLPKAELRRMLHQAVRLARARLRESQAGKTGGSELS